MAAGGSSREWSRPPGVPGSWPASHTAVGTCEPGGRCSPEAGASPLLGLSCVTLSFHLANP